MRRPKHDHTGNLMPACVPCNISKSALSLEQWRYSLQHAAQTLARNQSLYRHALRFGLITEHPPVVVFWFERYRYRKPFPVHLFTSTGE